MKSVYIIFELLIIPQIILSQAGTIVEEFQLVGEEQYILIPGSLGTPEQKLNFIVDIGIDRTWMDHQIYDYQSSDSFNTDGKLDSRKKEEYSLEGIIISDILNLNGSKVNDFEFLLASEYTGNEEITSVLGLGRDYDSYAYSLVHRLTESSITFMNQFSLKFHNDNLLHGDLIIGDVTHYSGLPANKKNGCKLVNDGSSYRWACQLTHIFVGGRGNEFEYNPSIRRNLYKIDPTQRAIKEIYQPFSFETIHNGIIIPEEQWYEYSNFLRENYFIYKPTSSSICQPYQNEEGDYTFICTQEEMNCLPDLNFVFDGNTDIYMTPYDMFQCDANKCIFKMRTKKGVRHSVMGINILKKFQFVFDYNSEDLLFYGDNNVQYIKFEIITPKPDDHTKKPKKGNSVAKGFGIFFLIIAIIAVIALVIVLVLRKKNQNKKRLEELIYQKF